MAPKSKVATKDRVQDAGEIFKIFQAFDKNDDKVITTQELGEVLKKLDKSWTDRKVQQLVRDMDTNGDGRIDYDEFVAWIMSTGRGGDKRKAVKQAAAKDAKEAPAGDDAKAAEGTGGAAGASAGSALEAALEELFDLYDTDEDDQLERMEHLEGEEKRRGQLNFTIVERRATIKWFKEAGATGSPTDGMFLSKDNWTVAMQKLAVEGAAASEDAALKDPEKWLRQEYGQLWRLAEAYAEAQKKSSAGGEADEGDGPCEAPPGYYPLTFDFKDLDRKLEEAMKFNKNVLVVTNGKAEVETFMSYRNFVLIDGKEYISKIFAAKSMSMEDAQADAKSKLTSAMNSSGFCKPIHFRLSNSALDFDKFCANDGFPAEVFSRSTWTIDRAFEKGFFDKGHKVLLESDSRWKTCQVVITSTFDLEGANSFLADKIPHFDELAILVVDPKSFG